MEKNKKGVLIGCISFFLCGSLRPAQTDLVARSIHGGSTAYVNEKYWATLRIRNGQKIFRGYDIDKNNVRTKVGDPKRAQEYYDFLEKLYEAQQEKALKAETKK